MEEDGFGRQHPAGLGCGLIDAEAVGLMHAQLDEGNLVDRQLSPAGDIRGTKWHPCSLAGAKRTNWTISKLA
jgi:hypothetical protein